MGSWNEVLKNCDLDGDGKIDYNEFFVACVNHKNALA